MKKAMRFAFCFSIVCIILAAGCVFEPRAVSETGSIITTLPFSLAGKQGPVYSSSGSIRNLPEGVRFRLYLERAGKLTQINGADYVEGESGDVISIDNLDPAYYKLYASISTAPEEEPFQVWRYGATDPVEVKAGKTSEATIYVESEETPFETVKTATNAWVSIINDYSTTVFSLEGGTLRVIIPENEDNPDYEDEYVLDVGAGAKSLSMGMSQDRISSPYKEMWVNTDQGILRVVRDMGNGMVLSPWEDPVPPGMELDTDHSGGLFLSGEYSDEELETSRAKDFSLMFYQGEGGLKGAYNDEWVESQEPAYTLVPENITWFDLFDNLPGFEFFGNNGPLANNELLFTDYNVYGSDYSSEWFAYVVPSQGLRTLDPDIPAAFRIGNEVIRAYLRDYPEGGSISYDWLKDVLFTENGEENIISISDAWDGENAVIRSVAAVDNPQDYDGGGRVYIGTDRGVYTYRITTDGRKNWEVGYTECVYDTERYDIVKVRAVKRYDQYGDTTYAAAITRDGSLLVLMENMLVKVYPFCAGLPMNPKDAFIYLDGYEVDTGYGFDYFERLNVGIVGDGTVVVGTVMEWKESPM
jgi:hypothetical protein